MALADRVAARRSRGDVVRSDPVTLEEFGYLLAQNGYGSSSVSKAGVQVGPQRALGISAWYSGVRYLAENVSALPVHTYRDGPQGRGRRADPPWVRKPDVETTWLALVELWMVSLLHRGNAYAFKVRNDAGQVVGLRGLHPDRVKPGQSDDGLKLFQIDNRTDVAFTTREVLHIPGLSYDGKVGLNPLAAQADALGIVAAADDYAGTFFGNSAHVNAYLTVPATLTADQANEMRAVWEDQHRGLVNAHRLAVIGGGAEYKTLSLMPSDMQLLEARQYGVTEVARMLRIPPHKLGDMEHATFSNIEHQAIEAVTDSIRPWVVRIEAWINADPDLLAPGNFIEFQLEGLLRGDTASRYEAYSKATGRPWMTPAEVRRLENLPTRDEPDLDMVAMPLNMDTGDGGMSLQEFALAVQKLYLGVGPVLTQNEAREALALPPVKGAPDGTQAS